MVAINQTNTSKKIDINIRAENLIRNTKILNIARLAKMLVDLYGQDEPFKKVGKHKGKEIELHIKEFDGYITFILTSDRNNFNCHAEKAIDPVKLGLPDFIGVVTTQAYTEDQHKAQCDAIEEICKEFNIKPQSAKSFLESFPSNMRGVFVDILPGFGGYNPVQAWGCWNFTRGGGGEWIGSYCSTGDIARYYSLAREITLKYNKPPQFYSRIMFGGHYCVARANICFDKNDPEDIEKTRIILKEIFDAVHQIDGVIMYKPPLWVVEHHKSKTLPATTELIKKIKKLLDPNNIMNPGQGIEGD